MKTTKKVLSVILAVLLAFACTAVAFAAELANYVVYNNTVSAFEGLKYNKGYHLLCVPEYVDFIDAVLAENKLPDDLDASEQYLVNEAVANIEAAKAELLTDKFLKAATPEIDAAFAEIDDLFAALGELTEEQQTRVDELKAQVNAMKADKANVSKAELEEIIAELEEIKAYIDSSDAADYSKYDYDLAAFAMLKDNRAYQELCIPGYSAYIDQIIEEVTLPRDLTVADQYLINDAVNKIAEAKALLISDAYMKASASDIDALIAEIEDYIAGLEDLTAAEQAKVDELQAKLDALKAEDKENVSRKELADIKAALESIKYELDDTRPADYTRYDKEVRAFSDLRYNKGYLELCTPDFIAYIDQILEEVALPRDLTVKDQYLIDEAVAKILDTRDTLISDEFMKADSSEIDELIAEIEKTLDGITNITDEVKDEVDALKEYLDELKNNKDDISKKEIEEIKEALEALKEILDQISVGSADYTDYNYWYPQVTARAQHPWYYSIFIPEYAEIVEAFIEEVTIPADLTADKQYIVDKAVATILDFDEKLRTEYFRNDMGPADYTDYSYWYPQITARAQHPYYYKTFDDSYVQIVEEFIAEVTIAEDLPAYKQYIIDEAVEKLLAFDEKLKNEDFAKRTAEAEAAAISDEAVECDDLCHDTGILGRLTYGLIRVLRSLFGIPNVCKTCGAAY